jgi:uracil-DNA glycosylase family 4
VRCAPPANRPTPAERDTCLPYLVRELKLLADVGVVVALGSFAWDGVLAGLRRAGAEVPRPKPKFGHGAEAQAGPYTLLGCFHPSQQNTFTGKLTEPMMDAVLQRARALGVGSRP